MDIINLTHDVIDVGKTISSVSSPKCGATSVFIGTTRDTFEGKMVYRLEYEAYESMAILEIKKICNEIREKWEVMHIAITHRLGHVPVEDACVIVVISSSHRKESLDATQFAMERLKAVAPIWKKEVYEDPNQNEESSTWKGNQECFWTKEGKELIKQDEEQPECSQ